MADTEEERNVPESVPHTPPVCRFHSQGKHCYYGKKCRFLHIRNQAPSSDPSVQIDPSQPEDLKPDTTRNTSTRAAPIPRPCRYFLAGFCSMEERCRFLHPARLPPVEDPPTRNPQPHGPSPTRDLKWNELTHEMVQKLRLTEIQQLQKRFPKDLLIIQEQQGVTYYRATVEATDPDWPFDLKEIDIMVNFPEIYPKEIFTLDIPLDQQLPQIMARHVQQASIQWLQAKHATNQLLGKVELLFRPFLRWLDRSLERLFIEGAKQLKKDMDLEKAGLQFISYQELQASVSEKQTQDVETEQTEEAASDRTIELESERTEEVGLEQAEDSADEDGVRLVENIKLQERPRGTEVQLLGLKLGHNTATVMTQNITIILRCNRCKVSAELSLTAGVLCAAQCEKCNADIRVVFTPSILHPYSTVLGYLQLHTTSALDLLLNYCLFTVGCLNCSLDTPMHNLTYGQTKEFNCEHCHNKLSIEAESAKFNLLQPRSNKTDPSTNTAYSKNIRDPAVQKGKPLPDKGTCKHYKQSHRWLRFPCCGRAYPCDVCHDEDQDHPMDLATRMICGFCAKEQVYGNGKPCVACGSMMTKGSHTSHWEGGQGCRNQTKMSRNDRQKYANINKTISRKAASEKK